MEVSQSQTSTKPFNDRKLQIVERRGAFKWLPVFCENDLVHGSLNFTSNFYNT